MKIKLLIADDDALIRDSLKIIFDIDDDFDVVGCVKNGKEAYELCLKEDIDIALLDVRMPVMDGVQATKEIVNNTSTKVLILTTFDEDEYINDAIRNGAKGYLLKSNSPIQIKDALKTIFNGNSVIQDIVLDKIKSTINNTNDQPFNDDLFTQREKDVIIAIAEGLSNKEISSKLFISEGTVKNYITSILTKTNLKHRTQIAIYYLKSTSNC